tara:strand:+ start:167 stop:445 length:279 start_codon:yes stop_codon:yes gene_type:complete
MPGSLLLNCPPVFEMNYRGVSVDIPNSVHKAIEMSRIPDVLEKVGPFGYFKKEGVDCIQFHLCVPSFEDIRDFLVSVASVVYIVYCPYLPIN